MQIRPETEDDRVAVSDVVGRAFDRPEVVELVDAIRASEHYLPDLALVATTDDGIVTGFVMESFATLVDGTARHRVLTLSPLAVAPEHQNQGIGRALVQAVVARAGERGERLITLEGSPLYYGRLGFEHSAPHGVLIPLPDGVPSEAAQVRLLAGYEPSIRGRLEYPPAFDHVSAH